MKNLITITVCVFYIIVQLCVLKKTYNKGREDGFNQQKAVQLEVHKIS